MHFNRLIRAGACFCAVYLGVVAGGGALAADAKAKAADTEPPQEFSLELGQQTFDVREGEPAQVKAGNQELRARITPKPTRLLDVGDVSLRYPSGYSFEYAKGDARTTWTLTGNRNWFKLSRYAPGQTAPKSLEQKADEFERALKRGKLARSPARYNLAGQPVEAIRTQWQQGNATFRADFLFFKAGDSTYELMVYDHSDTAAVTDETKRLVELLEQSLKIHK